MAESSKLGAKIRALRRKESLSQVQLAERLGISASYLNLIEHNRRPLSAQLLIRLAQLFQLDLQTFAEDDQGQLVSDLYEAFGDPLFEGHDLTSTEVKELVGQSPQLARAVITLYQAYRTTRDSAESLAGNLGHSMVTPTEVDRSNLPSEEVSDLIQRHQNYFPDIEGAAEMLWKIARLEPHDLYKTLAGYLDSVHGVRVRVEKDAQMGGAVRRYRPKEHVLELSEILPPRTRNFQLAHQIGLVDHADLFGRIAKDPGLTSEDARALAKVALANYFAGAVLMPYGPFQEAAEEVRYDIELLGHRFRASWEQVCHRLTTLQRPGAEGVPFHLVRIDIAGNISKRFSVSGFRFARFSGACPRWNEHAAFLTPGMVRTQLSQMPDGTTYFCVARTVRDDSGGYLAPHALHAVGLGCEVKHAKALVYAQGVDLGSLTGAVPIGVACRVCERLDCEQRAFPPLLQPLKVDENLRGRSFYVSVKPEP
jgi:predicted transcriptional regulator/transcriptional regulator with XRE-family HTH domain